jgi:mannose-6-phosphate isomerase
VDGRELTLRRGQSMWLPAADPDVVLAPVGDGRSRLFAATVGSETAGVSSL